MTPEIRSQAEVVVLPLLLADQAPHDLEGALEVGPLLREASLAVPLSEITALHSTTGSGVASGAAGGWGC